MSECKRSQKRVAIWSVARSLSTVFVRSLSQVPDSIVLFEEFTSALLYATGTFESAKAVYEQPREGKSLVLGKDMGFTMSGKFEMVPEGYQHIFLVRHPAKSIPSLEALLAPLPREQKEFYIGLNQYKPLFDLHRHVTSKLDQQVTILDAQDLIQNPEKTIQTLCQILGLPFSDRLLTWDPIDGKPSNWIMSSAMWEDCESLGWMNNCLRSTGFIKPAKQQNTDGEVGKYPLTPEIEKMIEEALPYYQALWELRIKLDECN
ncbi:uncharacterized protein LOC119744733 [Patiria miniata]|uniref:Sulfotransferase family protein n=1 Tax=Patiria miniata TaxID=46514 RepID=A0A914BMQ1_PATMI|nr:uncharacterized protein LOC119744733 [Patiria miniata]